MFGARVLGGVDQSPRRLRVRVQILLTVMLVTTNVVGAVLVLVISNFVVPTPAPNPGMWLALAIGVPVYVGVAVLVGAAFLTGTSLRAMRWIVEGKEPTDEDRVRTLRVPWRLTLGQTLLWAVATVLFTGLTVLLQPERALTTGLTLVISGVVISAIAYLLAEFALRPIAARALAGDDPPRPRGAGVGDRMVLFWYLGTGVPILGLVAVALVALIGDDYTITRLAVVVLVVGAAVLCFGFLVTVLNARSVVAPLVSVSNALQEVQRGRFDTRVPVYDGTELGLLQAGFNRMVDGLEEREHIRDMFGRHVGQEVAAAAARGEVELGGETRVATVLFIDLIGSTSFAAERSPSEVVEVLNRFFGVVVDEVDARGGFVNKFIGDAVLAIFGVPVELPDHAGAALAAARAMALRLAEEVPDVPAGIGVATGEVVAGNVGHRRRFEYTVIGNAVNAAARITELAKDVDGGLLVAWDSVEAASGDERERWAAYDEVTLRGRKTSTALGVPKA